jgi:hypothetical protein
VTGSTTARLAATARRYSWHAAAIVLGAMALHAARHADWPGTGLAVVAALACAAMAGAASGRRAHRGGQVAQRQHLAAAATDEGWQPHAPDDAAARPQEVVIGGTAYAVQPLTLPVMRAYTTAGAAVFELQQHSSHPLAQMLGTDQPPLGVDQVLAAYEAMYAQLATLLVDSPPPDELGLYVPHQRLLALLQVLGPQ